MILKTLRFFSILWELPQNSLGIIFFAFCLFPRGPVGVTIEGGRIFMQIKCNGLSLGHFIFWSTVGPGDFNGSWCIKRHEYGHSLQSMLFGPLYLPLIGLPSAFRFVYAKYYYLKNNKKWKNYFKGYPENWAESLGLNYFGK